MSKDSPENIYDVQFWNEIFDVELPKYKNQLEDAFLVDNHLRLLMPT